MVPENDSILFMDDCTMYEVMNVHIHISGTSIGYIQEKFDEGNVCAKNKRRQFNLKKCKEMVIDFLRQKRVISYLKVEEISLESVTSYLAYVLTMILNWSTNTEHIDKKAAKRLSLLKVLISFGAPEKGLIVFYTSVIQSAIEYGAQVLHESLTREQCPDIKGKALGIIYSEKTYEKTLAQ